MNWFANSSKDGLFEKILVADHNEMRNCLKGLTNIISEKLSSN